VFSQTAEISCARCGEGSGQGHAVIATEDADRRTVRQATGSESVGEPVGQLVQLGEGHLAVIVIDRDHLTVPDRRNPARSPEGAVLAQGTEDFQRGPGRAAAQESGP